ncbi:DUF6234 family protein [Streptomyces sp. cmx-4-9]|uniref:DUF6234 family protein n=1 Tax=Streptomyces sp. cmx-4-9 TaxID=2790941 RepID=UPI0039803F5B
MSTSPAPSGGIRGLVADTATALCLILLELLGLAAVFFVWALSGWNLDPQGDSRPDPVWGYLVPVGVLAVLMAWASLRASRRPGGGVTATTQAVMAMGTVVLILAAAYYQHREDTPPPPSPCLQSPSAPWCNG